MQDDSGSMGGPGHVAWSYRANGGYGMNGGGYNDDYSVGYASSESRYACMHVCCCDTSWQIKGCVLQQVRHKVCCSDSDAMQMAFFVV